MLRPLTRLFRRRHTGRPAKQARPRLKLEALEGREVPATLELTGGILTYTAAGGVANKLNVSASSAGTYTFQDAETINVVGIAGAAGSGTRTVTVPVSQVPAAGLSINLGDKNDALTVHSTLHAISVKAGADNDIIDIGTPVGGVLVAFSAPVTVDGEAGTDTVRVNDPSGFLGFYTVTATQVTRSSGFSLNYSGAENLAVNGGFFADSFDIRSTALGTRTTVSGGTGNDTFRVGSTANTLDGIQGTLTLDGGANDAGFEDQVSFADQGSAARSYTLRADNILARTGSAMVAYAGMERLSLRAGDFADSLAVAGAPDGMPITLDMGGGNDRVTIAAASLDSVRSRVTVDGGAGADSIVLNDQGDADANWYLVTSGSVSRNGENLLAYGAMEGLTLRAGSGHDLITVVSTAAQTPVVIRAGLGDDTVQLQEQSVVGLNGAVTVDGEGGTDTLDYFAYLTDVRVNLALGTATGAAGGVSNFENAVGGAGNDIIVGNDAANVLWGGDGRDVIIGRGGADFVIAEGGDDILVGASTAHDLSPARLEDLMREWSRTDLFGTPASQYNARVNHLLGAAPGGLNGATTLTVAQVADDGADDFLEGGTGLDWYVASADDTLSGLGVSERITYAPQPVNPTVGNVTVVLAGGNLYVNEAAGSEGLIHGVKISRLPNGNILVSGHNPTDAGGVITLVNGAFAMEFAVTGSLFVNLGEGEDELIFDTSAGATPAFGDVSIGMGTDDSPDRVIIWSIDTRGSLNVETGGGDDWVFLGGGRVGDGFGLDQFGVYTGAGADLVTVKNGTQINGWLDVQTYGSLSEGDADVVYFDTEAYVLRDVNVRTGGGDDLILATDPSRQSVFFGALTAGGSLTIDTGAGDDAAYLRGVTAGGNFSLRTGAGADVVTIDSRPIWRIVDDTYFIPRVGGDMLVQTYDSLAETDRDEVRILNGIFDGSLAVRLGGGDDFFSLDKAEIIMNDLDVDMGAGNDEAEVSGYVVDHMILRMGEGDDVLRLGKTWAYRLIADGGQGNDSLTKAYNTRAQYLDEFGWESIST